MNCVEVQEVLPEMIDGSKSSEFQAHLKSCPVCSELVSELELITSEARQLVETDAPPDRVWVRIAAELRAEGLIREPEAASARPVLAPSNVGRRWSAWWLVPVAAALVAAGSYVIKPKPAPQMTEKPAVVSPGAPQEQPLRAAAEQPSSGSRPTPPVTATKPPIRIPFPSEVAADKDDQQFLDEIARQAPMMRASYANELVSVNSYIRDATEYARQNPGDEDARQHLMDAYEQKAMLYQMALDHVQ